MPSLYTEAVNVDGRTYSYTVQGASIGPIDVIMFGESVPDDDQRQKVLDAMLADAKRKKLLSFDPVPGERGDWLDDRPVIVGG